MTVRNEILNSHSRFPCQLFHNNFLNSLMSVKMFYKPNFHMSVHYCYCGNLCWECMSESAWDTRKIIVALYWHLLWLRLGVIRQQAIAWNDAVITDHDHHYCITTGWTRTTRTPAFWDTPCHPMITHTSDSHQIPSQNKTKSNLQI